MAEWEQVRVLVIDTKAHIRRLIATLLGALGITQVVQARTPEAAMPLAKDVNLVIADWSGDPTQVLLFVHRLRRGELGDPSTPVLALSTSPHHAALERAWRAGIDDVAAKPLSAMEILERTTALLARRHREVRPAPAEAAE
ncbi:MAG: response regulator [Magnetospirillum sp.]|nr:response regulator [Magnetospirillum sp.]